MTVTSEAKVEVLEDSELMARRVAEWIIDLANAKAGNFAICLSGGSTPQLFYRHLADTGYRDRFPWPRAHWFWGDERFVPQDDALSNYRMVREALLSRAPIPPANIHAIPTEGIAPDAAATGPCLTSICSGLARTVIPSRYLPAIEFWRNVNAGSAPSAAQSQKCALP
jgi:6-phosphogluconolactonase